MLTGPIVQCLFFHLQKTKLHECQALTVRCNLNSETVSGQLGDWIRSQSKFIRVSLCPSHPSHPSPLRWDLLCTWVIPMRSISNLHQKSNESMGHPQEWPKRALKRLFADISMLLQIFVFHHSLSAELLSIFGGRGGLPLYCTTLILD